MTLEQLDRYQKLKIRRCVLRRNVEELQDEKVDRVTDIVEGSNKSFPFQRVRFSVSGLDPEQKKTRGMKIAGREREIEEINEKLLEIEYYISCVDDPIMKTCLELYYLNGATWPQVSNEIYGSAAFKDTLRISVQRFVEKNP